MPSADTSVRSSRSDRGSLCRRTGRRAGRAWYSPSASSETGSVEMSPISEAIVNPRTQAMPGADCSRLTFCCASAMTIANRSAHGIPGDRRILQRHKGSGTPRTSRRPCGSLAFKARIRHEEGASSRIRPRRTSLDLRCVGLHRRHCKGRPGITPDAQGARPAAALGAGVRASRHSRSRRVRGA